MSEASIPVDLFNPGQVFACLGLIEAAAILCGDVTGAFDWAESPRFFMKTTTAGNPIARVLTFLAEAQVVAEAPHADASVEKWIATWGRLELLAPRAAYPCREPSSPATYRASLRRGEAAVPVDYWGDVPGRDNAKFWGGARGYPGAARIRDALELARERCVAALEDPFALCAPQSSSLQLDWRRDYIPLDTGFSLNAHNDRIVPLGYPLVEVLAAIGLQYARPVRVTKLDYRYGALGRTESVASYAPSLLRAALGPPNSRRAALPFPTRVFAMRLGWPGKEGQFRSITSVTEELAK